MNEGGIYDFMTRMNCELMGSCGEWFVSFGSFLFASERASVFLFSFWFIVASHTIERRRVVYLMLMMIYMDMMMINDKTARDEH
jgi:hypothetical protein